MHCAVKKVGLFLWGLSILLSVLCLSVSPWGALLVGAVGGLGLGLYLWRQTDRKLGTPSGSRSAYRSVSWLYRYGYLLLCACLPALLFSNRLPVPLILTALGCLLLIWISRGVIRKQLATGTPLDLPVLLILLAALNSLSSTIDLRLSADAVCMLIAGIAWGGVLADGVDNEKKIRWAFPLFVCTGMVLALSSFLVMEFPPFSKFTLINALYRYLPELLPRKLHPNYLGGLLAFFLPAALWCLAFGWWNRMWAGLAVSVMGAGLLMTQCRSVIVATGVVFLIRTYRLLWVWMVGLLLALVGALLIHIYGLGILLNSETGLGFWYRLEFRQEIWKRAVDILQDFPLTGIGFRSFPQVVDQYYPLFDPINNIYLHTQAHAHNLYLETAAAMGLPGYIAFFALLGAWGGMIGEVLVITHRNHDLLSEEMLGYGLAGGVVAHLLYGITDAVSLGEKAGIVFWGIMGLTAVLWQRVCTKQISVDIADNLPRENAHFDMPVSRLESNS